MPDRKGRKGEDAFCFGECAVACVLGDTSHVFSIGGIIDGYPALCDDVASEKSGPAEGVGVRGRSPWVDNHIHMHIDPKFLT